nr:hypothetical protein [Micromonospora sp. DSM 115978]
MSAHPDYDTVLVLDFGAQYAQLIARRVRECHVYSEIVPWDTPVAELVLELAGAPPRPAPVLRRILERRGKGLARLLDWSRRSAVDVLAGFFGDSLIT